MEATKKGIAGIVRGTKDFANVVGYAFPSINPDSGRVLVTSGNAVVGYRVAAKLLAAGYPIVRVGTRDLDSVQALVKEGAESTDFNWEDEKTYEKALEGVKTVFVSAPGFHGLEEKFPAFIKACKHANVRHVVKLSFYHAMQAKSEIMPAEFGDQQKRRLSDNPFDDVPLVKMQGHCDKMLARSGIDYTVLFASHLMSNPLRYQGETIKSEKKFYGASEDKGVNYVSPNDVAEVAVRCILAHKDHSKKGYTLTGPAAIKDSEVAELIGKALNETVSYVNDESKVKDVDHAALEKVKATGVEEEVGFLSKDVHRICGHDPEAYEEYLEAKYAMTPKELAVFVP